ncbi:hypothetical protein M758_10G151500 [Ceratodon purpureus]|nr:hypothetical protein M758_10G151500 [Ceratodon purpureus]
MWCKVLPSSAIFSWFSFSLIPLTSELRELTFTISCEHIVEIFLIAFSLQGLPMPVYN